MENSQKPSFFVLYSARHQRCGRFVERTDFRVVTKDDLFVWSQDINAAGTLQPLPLHCDLCAEDIQATHVRIVMDVDPVPRTMVPEVEIQKFRVDDWIVKLGEDS